jgi:hypothetical protein
MVPQIPQGATVLLRLLNQNLGFRRYCSLNVPAMSSGWIDDFVTSPIFMMLFRKNDPEKIKFSSYSYNPT